MLGGPRHGGVHLAGMFAHPYKLGHVFTEGPVMLIHGIGQISAFADSAFEIEPDGGGAGPSGLEGDSPECGEDGDAAAQHRRQLPETEFDIQRGHGQQPGRMPAGRQAIGPGLTTAHLLDIDNGQAGGTQFRGETRSAFGFGLSILCLTLGGPGSVLEYGHG